VPVTCIGAFVLMPLQRSKQIHWAMADRAEGSVFVQLVCVQRSTGSSCQLAARAGLCWDAAEH
jgi:hypothetical protein